MKKKINVKFSLDQLEKIIFLGQRMSNVFYNMHYDQAVPESWRTIGKNLQEEWDELKKA